VPELPEVETIRIGLKKYLVGHSIQDVEVKIPKLFQGDREHIIGAEIVDVRRFGKGLVIDLSNKYSLAIHIKLTGQLVYRGLNEPKGIRVSNVRVGELPNKFSHVIFTLDKGSILYYNDPRRFGWIKVVETEAVGALPFFKDLGPEFPGVRSGEGTLDLEQFGQILGRAGTPIKQVLMDQKRMSGIGNIYANDSLYDAKIDPKKPSKELSALEVRGLFNSLKKVFATGLKYGGSSELNYVNALGEDGQYQNHTLIYGKKGEKCKRDGSVIQKNYLGGRGTYFCPTCQK
jgi:formamidopyrimidine-DNA glycosylase